MRMRMAVVTAAAGLVLLAGCGDDVKDAVGKAQGAASDAKSAAGVASDKAKALNDLAKVDPEFLKHPDKALAAARDTCAFMAKHKDKAKQAEEVRKKFDPIGASNLEAAQARVLLKILNEQVCPRID